MTWSIGRLTAVRLDLTAIPLARSEVMHRGIAVMLAQIFVGQNLTRVVLSLTLVFLVPFLISLGMPPISHPQLLGISNVTAVMLERAGVTCAAGTLRPRAFVPPGASQTWHRPARASRRERTPPRRRRSPRRRGGRGRGAPSSSPRR